MSAINIEVLTLEIQNPDSGHPSQSRWTELPGDISFQQQLASPLVTLSTNNAPTNDDISGLLYLPTLAPEQLASCPEANDTSIIPRNITTRAALPPQYGIIALAPWIPQNSNCTFAFLSAAQSTMIVYQPDDRSFVPRADDGTWEVDGGDWRKSFDYPVYAVPGVVGAAWMHQLSLYSGNATDVPEGHALVDSGMVQATDYIRLMADISTGGGNAMPSLWVFLLMVVAILIIIIASTSCVMHCVARRRRHTLRRRVVTGEVDLEALGIKRLRVPQEVLDKMPKYEYTERAASAAPTPLVEKTDPITVATVASSVMPGSVASKGPAAAAAALPTSLFHQQTCAICLDDFLSATAIAARPSLMHRSSNSIEQSKEVAAPRTSEVSEDIAKSDTRSIRSTTSQITPSMVRELPCGHIFHANCVDPFLTTHSSLCPLCKKSSLPMGFVPRNITNTMVRRERQARALRSRGVRFSGGAIAGPGAHTFMTPMQRMLNARAGLAGLRAGSRHSAQRQSGANTQGSELQNMSGLQPAANAPPAPAAGTSPPGNATGLSQLNRRGDTGQAPDVSNEGSAEAMTNNELLAEAREVQEAGPQRQRPPWVRGMVRKLFPVA